ncbi:uncharacterized protein VTP21DRAFT_3015 [Calcarisporiella thermophila]|uniref:uncharacterized protein n=1 Tax=Calcarisporiella thermophila TaxID=911321 RepID=UPI003742F4FA
MKVAQSEVFLLLHQRPASQDACLQWSKDGRTVTLARHGSNADPDTSKSYHFNKVVPPNDTTATGFSSSKIIEDMIKMCLRGYSASIFQLGAAMTKSVKYDRMKIAHTTLQIVKRQLPNNVKLAFGYVGFSDIKMVNLMNDRAISDQDFARDGLDALLRWSDTLDSLEEMLKHGSSLPYILIFRFEMLGAQSIAGTFVLTDLGCPRFNSTIMGVRPIQSQAPLSKSFEQFRALVTAESQPAHCTATLLEDSLLTKLGASYMGAHTRTAFFINLEVHPSPPPPDVIHALEFASDLAKIRYREGIKNIIDSRVFYYYEFRGEMQRLQVQVEEQAKTCEETEKRLADTKETLRKENEVTRKKYESLKVERSQLKEKIQLLEASHAHEISVLSMQLVETREKIRRAEVDLTLKDCERDKFQAENEKLKGDLQMLKNIQEDLLQKAEQLDEQIETLEAERDNLEALLSRDQSEHHVALQSECNIRKELESQLEKLQEQVAQTQEELEKEKAARLTTEQERNQVVRECEELKHKLQRMETVHDREYTELQRRLKELEEDLTWERETRERERKEWRAKERMLNERLGEETRARQTLIEVGVNEGLNRFSDGEPEPEIRVRNAKPKQAKEKPSIAKEKSMSKEKDLSERVNNKPTRNVSENEVHNTTAAQLIEESRGEEGSVATDITKDKQDWSQDCEEQNKRETPKQSSKVSEELDMSFDFDFGPRASKKKAGDKSKRRAKEPTELLNASKSAPIPTQTDKAKSPKRPELDRSLSSSAHNAFPPIMSAEICVAAQSRRPTSPQPVLFSSLTDTTMKRKKTNHLTAKQEAPGKTKVLGDDKQQKVAAITDKEKKRKKQTNGNEEAKENGAKVPAPTAEKEQDTDDSKKKKKRKLRSALSSLQNMDLSQFTILPAKSSAENNTSTVKNAFVVPKLQTTAIDE